MRFDVKRRFCVLGDGGGLGEGFGLHNVKPHGITWLRNAWDNVAFMPNLEKNFTNM
jgi:hypothetical protein